MREVGFYIAPQRESFCYTGRSLLRTKIPYFGILTSEYNLFLVMLSFVCFLSSFCHHMLNINHDLSTVPTRYFESFGFSFERMLWSWYTIAFAIVFFSFQGFLLTYLFLSTVVYKFYTYYVNAKCIFFCLICFLFVSILAIFVLPIKLTRWNK